MNKLTKIVTVAIAAATIGATGTSFLPVTATTKTDISSTQTSTQKLLAQLKAANAEVIKLDDQITAKNTAITDTTTEIASTQTKITGLKASVAKSKKELAARTNTMREQLKSLQKKAGDSVTGNAYVDFLLKAKNLSDALGRVKTVNGLSKANAEAVKEIKDTKIQLGKQKKTLEATKAKQVAAKNTLVADKAKLVKLKSTAKAKQTALNKKINANKSKLKALQATFAKQQAAAKAAKLTKTASKSTATSGNHKNHTGEGNTYPWGQCTWYVKQVAPWVGNYWGNGTQWSSSAAAEGFTVNHTPAVGAVVVFHCGQSVGSWTADPTYGHVAYVTAVNGNSITIQQGGMGFSSPAGPNTETIGNASSYDYIHK